MRGVIFISVFILFDENMLNSVSLSFIDTLFNSNSIPFFIANCILPMEIDDLV